MKILLRADSSINIGTGHITRCLNLAQKLREVGVDITFISRVLDGNVISLVEEKQFKVIKLPFPSSISKSNEIYNLESKLLLKHEIAQMEELLLLEKPDWVIVDHYYLPYSWEEAVRATGTKVFVIDDIFRPHTCEAILDQNYHSEHLSKWKHLLATNPRSFLGPKYCLLSSQFEESSVPKKNFNEVKSLLVFFGGTDPGGETIRLLKILNKLSMPLEIHVVAGKSNPRLKEVLEAANELKSSLHIQTTRMAELMKGADLFIGAGGTTTWERCRLGLPSICLAIAENQVEISEALHRDRVLYFMGKSQEISNEEYEEQLLYVLNNPSLRQEFSNNSLKLEVGSKTEEIIEYLVQTSF